MTRKDNTLVEILGRLKNLEAKIDSFGFRGTFTSSTSLETSPQPSILESAAAFDTYPGVPSSPPLASSIHSYERFSGASVDGEHYKYASSVHQMLGWPTIQQLLKTVQSKIPTLDLSSVERDRPTIMLSLHKSASQGLPTDTAFTSLRPASAASEHVPLPGFVPITVSSLNWDSMKRLSTAYFDTFNLFHPVLDRHSFMSETMPSVFHDGFGPGMASIITFLVLALGETALSGSDGIPVHSHNGRPSGVKGGSRDRPPGLNFFNEAKKQMGYNLTECSIENVQIFILAR